jgi:hypothetical protein
MGKQNFSFQGSQDLCTSSESHLRPMRKYLQRAASTRTNPTLAWPWSLCCNKRPTRCLKSLHVSSTLSGLFASFTHRLSAGQALFSRYLHKLASAMSGLLPQSRTSRSESTSKGISLPFKELEAAGSSQPYPGSLHRHQRSITTVHYRSMLDIEDVPVLRPIAIPQEESMEDWVSERLSQTARKYTTNSSDGADILCFYTATNGVAPVAPTRASPAPQANGKAVSPQQEATPQTVSSTDPKVAAQQASDMRNIVRRKLTGYVGFANLPNQWHRKSVRKGFNFNVMVVGMYRHCPLN